MATIDDDRFITATGDAAKELAKAERRRARELSHYITKAEALSLVTNLLERHQRLHHAPGGFWRRFWAKWRSEL